MENEQPKENRILLILAGCVVFATCCIVCSIFSYALIAPRLANSLSSSVTNNAGDEPETSTDAEEVEEEETPVDTSKRVGDFSVNLNNVEKVEDTVVLDLSIKNESITDKSFSTIINLEVTDATGKQYYQSFIYDIVAAERLDRKVPANASVRGKVAYTVKDNPRGLKLTVMGGFLSEDEAVFPINL